MVAGGGGMIDLPRLRSDYPHWEAGAPVPGSVVNAVAEVLDAEPRWWCDNHRCQWGYNPNCGWSPKGKACPKTQVVVLPVSVGDEE